MSRIEKVRKALQENQCDAHAILLWTWTQVCKSAFQSLPHLQNILIDWNTSRSFQGATELVFAVTWEGRSVSWLISESTTCGADENEKKILNEARTLLFKYAQEHTERISGHWERTSPDKPLLAISPRQFALIQEAEMSCATGKAQGSGRQQRL